MLKWTASAQKLTQLTPKACATLETPHAEAKRRRRRATIANKENIPYTSTPMVARERNSPLVPTPLADVLNITPKSTSSSSLARTPDRRNVAANTQVLRGMMPQRRHSTVGFLMSVGDAPYASTLPRFEEEYSPSTILPTGQQVALRGLLPDPFLGNPRYFNTPELAKQQQRERQESYKNTLPKKRKLEHDFMEIAQQCGGKKTASNKNVVTSADSAEMGDQTLDKLIDAILDSARKDEKKLRTRKSFNLRRRTLLKNQAETMENVKLSPSYAAGDDPASDLSFLCVESTVKRKTSASVSCAKMPATPVPATPPPGTRLTQAMLQQLPTPVPYTTPSLHYLRSGNTVRLDTTFQLETPVRKPLAQKRRQRYPANPAKDSTSGSRKQFKVGACDYFDVGVALPSIYV